jgi:hypothetical protein
MKSVPRTIFFLQKMYVYDGSFQTEVVCRQKKVKNIQQLQQLAYR